MLEEQEEEEREGSDSSTKRLHEFKQGLTKLMKGHGSLPESVMLQYHTLMETVLLHNIHKLQPQTYLKNGFH